MRYPLAKQFARKCHQGIFRKNGEPYILHPIRVAQSLSRVGCREVVVMAGVLHDTIETGEVSQVDLCELFGEETGHLVSFVSKYPQHFFKDEEYPRLMRFKAYLERFDLYMKTYPEIMLIKMADQIDNLSSLKVFPKEKQQELLREIEVYFLPLYQKFSIKQYPELRVSYQYLLSELEQAVRCEKQRMFTPK